MSMQVRSLAAQGQTPAWVKSQLLLFPVGRPWAGTTICAPVSPPRSRHMLLVESAGSLAHTGCSVDIMVTSGHFCQSAQATADVYNRKFSWSDAQSVVSQRQDRHPLQAGWTAQLPAPRGGDITIVHYLCPVMRGPPRHYSVMPGLALGSGRRCSAALSGRCDSQPQSCFCSRERGWQRGCLLVHHPSLTPAQAQGWGAAGVLACAPKPQPGTRVRSNLVTHLLWNESTCGRGLFSASL